MLASERVMFRHRSRLIDERTRARTREFHHGGFFVSAPAGDPDTRLACRAERDPIQPVSQQVRLADRPGLASQHKEDRLEGVLGVVSIAKDMPADMHDHRPVAAHECGEGGLACRIAQGAESVNELAVGQSGDGTAVEQRGDLSDYR